MKLKKRNCVVFVINLIVFCSMALICGLRSYGDSEQYLTMHIHREPLYPFLLWCIRNVFGNLFEIMTLLIQAVFAAACTSYFVNYMGDTFELPVWGIGLTELFTLMPHIMTPLFSVTRLVLSASILSEAICLPLFLVFLVEIHKAGVDFNKKAIGTGFVLSLLLALIRGQMLATIVMWILVVGFRLFLEKQYKGIILAVLFVALFFGARGFLIKSYNYVYNDRFIMNTYGALNTLTNVMYAADREQGEAIEDEELRTVFYLLYDDMDEKQYNYKYAWGTLDEKIAKLEIDHDNLKFYVLESGFQQYFEKKGITDYIDQNILADEYSTALMKELLPGCLWRWGGNYLMLGIRGLIRNIAVVHPILNIYAIGIFAAALVKMFLDFKADLKSKEAWLLLIALLTVLGVSFSTALTIMCLQRYMVYGFTGFYTACFVVFIKEMNKRKG